MSDHRAIEDTAQALLEATGAPLIVLDPFQLPHLEDCDPDEQRCSCSSRGGFEPGGHPCHCLASLLEIGSDGEPITTVKAAEIDVAHMQNLVRKAVGLDPAMQWPAVMSVLRDLGRRGDLLALSEGDRLSSVEARVDALELAERERAQSGGAEHVTVAGGSTPEPCPVKGWNAACVIDMVCAYDRGHLSPHYNPSSGGWEWDDEGHVTALDHRAPTEYRLCGADRGDGSDPRTCQRRVRHDGICGPQRDT